MKVLFLTNIPTPYRVDFFNSLGNLCDLTVLFERKDAKNRNNEWLSNDSHNFSAVYLPSLKFGNDFALSFGVFKWLNDKSYDLIIIGGYSTPIGMIAIEYLNLIKKNYILNCDGGFKKNDNPLKYSIKKHFISKANAWLSTSHGTNEYLIYYGANAERIYKYPFTSLSKKDILDSIVSKSEKNKIKEKLGIKESKMILSVGQFIPRKGLDTLINSCKNIPEDIAICIIGDEPTDEYLALVKSLNLNNVYFPGFKTNDDLKEYYKAADLFVLPTREDIWGLVINEAMANGLPVITTDKCVAGLEMIKSGENGFIVPIDDSETIAEKINFLFNSEKIIEKMSVESIKTAKKYTIEQMAQKHIEILNSKDNLM